MAQCKACGQEIIFVEMRDTGRKMPLDSKPEKFVVVKTADGRGEVVTGHISHFATCNEADRFRNKNKKGLANERQENIF